MKISDLIIKKKSGNSLSKEEIDFIINGYVAGLIPDYQISALLMAICFVGMDETETGNLTSAMMHSGEVIDLSAIAGIKVDKHSTGGVGDKTSLVLGPLVASCGVKVAKMSGRGLGHTGGTIDKLESIPGFKVELKKDDFINQVQNINIALIGQSGNLVPADKKLYALRDVTGTVESIPLIASSIMSKKLATGADAILLDVKCGNGAFMKDLSSAKKLAEAMCRIGTFLKRDTRAIITDMDQPLGKAIGNSSEVIEAINTLKGQGPQDLHDLCIYAGALMLLQAKRCQTEEEAKALLESKIASGAAFKAFKDMVAAQGGDVSYLDDVNKFPKAKKEIVVKSVKAGYIDSVVALVLGETAMKLGAGREKKEDVIDFSAGIYIEKKVGDLVAVGDVLAVLSTNADIDEKMVIKDMQEAFIICNQKVSQHQLIKAVIDESVS